METAKVDVRKLQMLNDRINQTIEALNQVRLSVHGISHSGISGVGNIGTQFAPTGYAGGNTFGGGYPYAPQGMPQVGFGHTGLPVNPQTFGLQNPFLSQLAQTWGTNPWGTTNGFAHAGVGETLDPSFVRRTVGNVDLFGTSRIAQTFPFVQWGYSPFASGSSPFASGMY